ncbi:HEC/Ndc80p family domain-containing protein [Ditylenchus destructor]|nr:HEC/Ndc80p family domain-containing protein [Ditylenchus destructor]
MFGSPRKPTVDGIRLPDRGSPETAMGLLMILIPWFTPASSLIMPLAEVLASGDKERRADPVRNSVAPGFGTRSSAMRPSITMRPSLAVRNSFVPGSSLSGKMSLLGGNPRRMPPPMISGKTGTIKDTRNVTDKQVITKMVNKLINFFRHSEGVPFVFGDKNIRHPGRKDFHAFFEFIFRHLFDNYRLDEDPKAMNEEVPKLLNALGYPYPIKNSYMTTLGAQHSWPYLLGALDWLIDFVYMQSEDSLVDQLTYSYFVTCYKKQKEKPEEAADFTDEIQEYRKCLLKTDTEDMDTELDELKTRRLNNEKAMLQIKDELVKDQEDIREIEVDIGNLHTDVKKMEKYYEDLLVLHARIDENIASKEDVKQKLSEALNTMMEENQRKEMQIASQTMSADKARELMSKRNALREQITSERNMFNKCEQKHYDIQPQYYKQSRDLQNTYEGLISSLQEFCSSIPTLTEKIEWSVYDFNAVLEEFMNPATESSNRVEKLMEQITQELDQIRENGRQNRDKLDRLIEKKQAEVQTIKAAKEQKQLENKLEVERYHREVEDSARGIRNSNMSSELLRQKHQTAKDELQELNDRNIQLRDKHLEVEKKYIAEKNDLEKLYNDIVAKVLDKVAYLYKRSNEIMKCKDELKDLGEQMTYANERELQSIRVKKTELHLQ